MDTGSFEELDRKRRALRGFLSPDDARDALASYYALWHDPRRTRLTLHHDDQGTVDGFVAVCQTGADLFRPLVILRARDEEAIPEMLESALAVGRPYQVMAPVSLALLLEAHLTIGRSGIHRLYQLNPHRFQRVINVLVQRTDSPEGTARFQIESQGQVVALSGINWRSDRFAEVFVYVHPEGRGRGWGRSVVSACTSFVLEERLRPLYLVDEENYASIHIAEAVGYTDTGHRLLICDAQRK